MIARALDAVFSFCASLKLAVVSILSIAGLLGVATFYEARYGIAPVQERVYGSNLFLASLAMLAINVMAAAVIRYPWKRKQTGFVITHIGILVLLGGCLLSLRTSIDGRVVMQPGDTASDFMLGDERLQVASGGRTWSTPVRFWGEAGYPSVWRALLPGWGEPGWVGPDPVFTPAPGTTLEVLEWLPAAKVVRGVVAGDSGDGPAVGLVFAGSTPNGAAVREEVYLAVPGGETVVRRELFGGLIEVELRAAEGEVAATRPVEASGPRGRLVLTQMGDGRLRFESVARSGAGAAGVAEVGKEVGRFLAIGVSLTGYEAHGRVEEKYVAAHVRPNKLTEAQRAVRVAVMSGGQRREVWVPRGAAPTVVEMESGRVTLAYGFAGGELPFAVTMVSARRTNDPGSSEAAAYESAVMVTHKDKTKTRHTITLNNPLTVGNVIPGWGGYTFYQSSFDESLGFVVSTLSIRRDLGTIPKYVGSGLICLGIFTMFYMKAYFQKPGGGASRVEERELVGGAA